jgi:hypothetical protein
MGNELIVTCVPDATFKAELVALEAAATAIVGKLVTWTFANNYEVTSAAESAVPNGEVVAVEKRQTSSGVDYYLSVRVWSYVDQNGTYHCANQIVNVPYSGTFNLQDTILVNTTTYLGVKDGGTAGIGACVAKDVPASGYADILL